MRKIGIIQPNYIPWRGYFDFINDVDVFVFLDDVQYTVRDWRNRNRIKNHGGAAVWLTVPVTGGRNQSIKDVQIDNNQKWKAKHLATIRQTYGQTPHFDSYFGELKNVYDGHYIHLCDLDIALTQLISCWLGIETEFLRASDIHGSGQKDDRLLQIVQHLNGGCYQSGPAAKSYMRPEIWKEAGIAVEYKSYPSYPEYCQVSDPFEPAVSIIDLLFMVGSEAPEYIWGKYLSEQ